MSLEEQLDSYRQRVSAVQGPASQAFARLIDLAEHQNSGQIRSVVLFLASTYNGWLTTINLAP